MLLVLQLRFLFLYYPVCTNLHYSFKYDEVVSSYLEVILQWWRITECRLVHIDALMQWHIKTNKKEVVAGLGLSELAKISGGQYNLF